MRAAARRSGFVPADHNGSCFASGSIVCIHVKDFLIYDDVEVRPGPYLNVIVGPNGSGKSSIVCAIALGLGGNPAVIGRSKVFSDYIKHGKTQASIRLELHDPQGNQTIQRIIRKAGSEWHINTRKVKELEVKELAKHYGIQVNNLCQFLAQDRVCEFARQTPQQLLENTEKAIDADFLFARHDKLKSMKDDRQNYERLLANDIEKRDNLRTRVAQLQPEVEAQTEREQHEKKIQLLLKKRAWIEYEEARGVYEQKKERLKQAKEEREKLIAENEPMERRKAELKQRKSQLNADVKAQKDILTSKRQKLDRAHRDLDDLEQQIADCNRAITGRKAEEEDRQRRMDDCQKELEGLKNKLSNIDVDENEIREKIRANAKAISDADVKINQFDEQKSNIQLDYREVEGTLRPIQDELGRLANEEKQRAELLSRRDKEAYAAYTWLQQHRNEFRAPIHGPIMLCVKMKNHADAKYLESVIASRDQVAFVCEDGDDSDDFLKIARENRWRINVVTAPRRSMADFRNGALRLDAIRQFGFEQTLLDLFDAPEAVTRYICQQCKVHTVPVGSGKADQKLPEIVEYIKKTDAFRLFFTPSKRVFVKVSKYSGKTSSSTSGIRPAQFLQPCADPNRILQLTAQLKEGRTDLARLGDAIEKLINDKKQFEVQRERLRQERKNLQGIAGQRQTLQTQIGAKEASLRRIQSQGSDLEEFEAQKLEEIARFREHQMKVTATISDLLKDNANLAEKISNLSLEFDPIQDDLAKVASEYADAVRHLEALTGNIDELDRESKKARDAATKLRKIAQEQSGVTSDKIPEALLKALEGIPNTTSLDGVDAAVDELQVRLNLLVPVENTVLREYHDALRNIDDLDKAIKQHSLDFDNFQGGVNTLRDEWLQSLEHLVEQIDDNYGRFFASLGCAGEVSLDKGVNPEDYGEYGIKIKVKFRENEHLQELTGYRQSGGERSVSTILYLLALQKLSQAKVVCCDEINQGMDPANERRVFEMMVGLLGDESEQKARTQYFMLTPKLLPNLEYNEKMTVLTICNGAGMLPATQWNIQRFLEIKRALNDNEG